MKKPVKPVGVVAMTPFRISWSLRPPPPQHSSFPHCSLVELPRIRPSSSDLIAMKRRRCRLVCDLRNERHLDCEKEAW